MNLDISSFKILTEKDLLYLFEIPVEFGFLVKFRQYLKEWRQSMVSIYYIKANHLKKKSSLIHISINNWEIL